jgi:hypothetical protein
MATVKCETCGGVYDQTIADGSRYFHTCPPLLKLRVRLADGTIELRDGRVVFDEEDDPRGGKRRTMKIAPPLKPGETFLEEVPVERPDHRDENVKGGQGRERSERKKDGKGTSTATR